MLPHFAVGIVVARRKLQSQWASHSWAPVAALPAAPDLPAGTPLGAEDCFYAGSAVISLHVAETGHYRDNLASAQPSVWVVLRPTGEEVELASVTVDPYEGEALAESIGDIVEAVPMPSEVQAWVHGFIEAFHVERAFVKRKRDRADPDALGRRGRVSRGEDEE